MLPAQLFREEGKGVWKELVRLHFPLQHYRGKRSHGISGSKRKFLDVLKHPFVAANFDCLLLPAGGVKCFACVNTLSNLMRQL